jgi:predicted PurR-regulated permease PerM
MEILSFSLGIAFVVVIAIAVVAVYAFVKVTNIRKELDTVYNIINSEIDTQNKLREDLQRHVDRTVDNMYSSLNEKTDYIHRVMDSRFDKFENKFNSQEQVKK